MPQVESFGKMADNLMLSALQTEKIAARLEEKVSLEERREMLIAVSRISSSLAVVMRTIEHILPKNKES